MVLQDYKIDGDYIKVSKAELEKWRDQGKGKAQRYKWNLAKFGPPSLALAERMIFETEDQLRISARARYRARVERTKIEENSRGVEVIEER